MTLYSTPACIEGHACRMVLNEKEVECDVEFVDLRHSENPIELWNPYKESPTLIDRDVVLYGSHIIAEYLDDRLPHPPLMPPDPASRSRVRMMIYRCQRDWLHKLSKIEKKNNLEGRNDQPNPKLRRQISEGLTRLSPYLSTQDFWLGSEFTLVDCFMAPLLWRLVYFRIELPPQLKSIPQYANRLFARESFSLSLSQVERDMNLS